MCQCLYLYLADPLSRRPFVVAHMMLCALKNGVDDDLMADSDIVADTLRGCANIIMILSLLRK